VLGESIEVELLARDSNAPAIVPGRVGP